MKSINTKALQIFFISLFVGVGIFAVLSSPVLAAKDSAKEPTEEKLLPYRCVEKTDCEENDGYKFIPQSDSRAKECPENQGRCIVDKKIKLNVPIPGSGSSVKNINDYIDILFKWLLQLGGVIAAAVIVWGGYIYITAAGNQAKISQAKETITGGIIGLMLLFGSYTILGFLNQRILENMPNAIDKIDRQEYSIDFCTTETPTPANDAVTCGQPAKNSDKSGCISKECGTNADYVCVRAVLKIGLGLSGNKQGYKCINKTDKNAVEDACEENVGISDFKDCAILDGYLKKITSSSKACGFGVSSSGQKECKLGTKLGNATNIACSVCGLSPNTGTVVRGESGSRTSFSASTVVNLDKNGEEEFRLFCGNRALKNIDGANTMVDTTQTKWIIQSSYGDNVKYVLGAICESSGKIYTGYEGVIGNDTSGPKL